MPPSASLIRADARRIPLADGSVHCVATSPPYFGLRDYGADGQIGLEKSPDEYVAAVVGVFREVKRVLRDDGICWLNLGDSYAVRWSSRRAEGRAGLGDQSRDRPSAPGSFWSACGVKEKDLIGIPWRVAFALQSDGWYLRSDVVWEKPNPMPESVRDRPTKAHEYLFLLAKTARYYYDADAIREPHARLWNAKTNGGSMATTRHHDSKIGGSNRHKRPYPEPNPAGRNKRSVWTVATRPYRGAHFATMPPDLVRPCVRAGTSERGCCPACGAPWVRVVERESIPGRPNSQSNRGNDASSRASLGAAQRGTMFSESRTLGWQPSCACPAVDPVPCTVFDPFAGSGTTLAVAIEEGRSAVGTELNPDYLALATRRIAEAQAGPRPSRPRRPRPPRPAAPAQRSLFGDDDEAA